MLVETFAVIIAVGGGLVGVFGDTWDPKNKKLSWVGWCTIVAVLAAGIVGLFQISNTVTENERRAERQSRFSYQALIDVHGPLAMFLGQLDPQNRDFFSTDRPFPPPLHKEHYERWHGNRDLLRDRAEWLSNSIPASLGNGRVTTDHASNFAARYRFLTARLDETIAVYGPHVSDEVLDHLTALRTHSLFRRTKLERERNEERWCRGSIDELVLDAIDRLESNGRCISKISQRLYLMFQDPYPAPPFTDVMRKFHEDYCRQVGVQIPHCAWEELI